MSTLFGLAGQPMIRDVVLDLALAGDDLGVAAGLLAAEDGGAPQGSQGAECVP
jgi:hypothetical protein